VQRAQACHTNQYNTRRGELVKQAKQDGHTPLPPELLLKVLEAADTPVTVIAAISHALQQAVLLQNARRLSLTIDPDNPAQMGSGLANLAWLSRTSGSTGGRQRRTGPLRLSLKSAAGSEADLPAAVLTAAARVLLHAPLQVVTHLELHFANDITQADVDALWGQACHSCACSGRRKSKALPAWS
jgi:hypothetical protein